MSTIMKRKAAEFWWNFPIKGKEREKFVVPNNVAYYTNDINCGFGVKPHWVATTWADVHKKRTKKIQEDIRIKRGSSKIKPCLIWVFYNNTSFFCGWWIYVKILKKDFALNFRTGRRHDDLVIKIMSLYPCSIIPLYDNFYQWCEEFSKLYSSNSFGGRKKQGLKSCYCLLDEYDELKDFAPDFVSLNGA